MCRAGQPDSDHPQPHPHPFASHLDAYGHGARSRPVTADPQGDASRPAAAEPHGNTRTLPGEDTLPDGLYLISERRPTASRIPVDAPSDDEPPSGVIGVSWSSEARQFLAVTTFGTVLGVMPEGRVLWSVEEASLPTASPDGRWLAFTTERGRPGIRIYSRDGEFVRALTEEKVREVVWLPDSSGLLYLVGMDPVALKTVSLDGGEPRLVLANSGFDRDAYTPLGIVDR
jgi:hypothetical protein